MMAFTAIFNYLKKGDLILNNLNSISLLFLMSMLNETAMCILGNREVADMMIIGEVVICE